MKQNGKIKENAGPVDKLISVITYIVFALFSPKRVVKDFFIKFTKNPQKRC